MSFQSCNSKQLWLFEKNFPWIDDEVQSTCELLLFATQHDYEWETHEHWWVDAYNIKDGEDIKNNYKWWKGSDFDVKHILQVGEILRVNQQNAIWHYLGNHRPQNCRH